MRRSLTVSIAIVFLILSVGLFCEGAAGEAARHYQGRLTEINARLQQAEWTEARQMLLALSSQWEKESGWMQLWIHHAETVAVSHALRGLIASAQAEDPLSCQLYFDECMENFDHLHHRDAFTLKNIL